MINVTKIIDKFQYSEYSKSEKLLSKHPRLHFFLQMSGCITVLVIHYNIHCINNFRQYYAYASSEESGKFRVYSLFTWSMITFHTLGV